MPAVMPALALVVFLSPPSLSAQPRQIDAANSVLTVQVYKSGLFSAFAHDHEIAAPIAAGTVDTAARRVELRVRVPGMQVRDPRSSEKERAEIQKKMLGPDVLDADRYPEIVFQSSSASTKSDGAWTLQGTLTLHGNSRPVTVEVRQQDGRWLGFARLKQTEFGIEPIRIAGGTVRVKDEVRVQFEIRLTF